MSKLYNTAKKAFFEPIKKTVTKIAQKTSGQGQTRGEAIKYVKPKLTNLEGEKKKAVLKAKSDVQKKFGPVNEGVQKEVRNLRQSLQKLRKEPVTKSGISKGSNLTPGIYESAAKGRKQLKFGGSSNIKSNVQKIKEAFSPKKSDLNKDGKLSGYEKKRGMAIAKAMKGKKNGKVMSQRKSGSKEKI